VENYFFSVIKLFVGVHRESLNMVTPAMQLASKIPDLNVQLWASAILKVNIPPAKSCLY
jgi:hypothetical protein